MLKKGRLKKNDPIPTLEQKSSSSGESSTEQTSVQGVTSTRDVVSRVSSSALRVGRSRTTVTVVSGSSGGRVPVNSAVHSVWSLSGGNGARSSGVRGQVVVSHSVNRSGDVTVIGTDGGDDGVVSSGSSSHDIRRSDVSSSGSDIGDIGDVGGRGGDISDSGVGNRQGVLGLDGNNSGESGN